MDKVSALIGILCGVLWPACGPDAQTGLDHGFDGSVLVLPESNQSLDINSTPDFVKFKLSFLPQGGGNLGAQFSADVVCDNVGDGKEDWSKTVAELGNTIALVADQSCSIVLNTYNDGSRTFTPVLQALTIDISPDGQIEEGRPAAYTSGPPHDLVIWLLPRSLAPFSLMLSAGPYSSLAARGHRGHSPLPTKPGASIDITSIPLAIAHVPPPVLNNLSLYVEEGINGAPISYTLVADVSGAVGCKYIDNSNNAYPPTEWFFVDSAYRSGAAQDCPSLDPADPGFASGNWNGLWTPSKKMLMVWVNTINGLSSYTSANVGPQ